MTQNFFQALNFFRPEFFFWSKMNFYENDLCREKTEILKLRLSKLASAKIILKLEFDTKDQILNQLMSCIWLTTHQSVGSVGQEKNFCKFLIISVVWWSSQTHFSQEQNHRNPYLTQLNKNCGWILNMEVVTLNPHNPRPKTDVFCLANMLFHWHEQSAFQFPFSKVTTHDHMKHYILIVQSVNTIKIMMFAKSWAQNIKKLTEWCTL